MQKYRWVKFPRGPLGTNYIYNIEEGCIYEFNWIKRKLGYNPEQGDPIAVYQSQKYIFCTKNNKSTFYYPNINKVEDLSIDIDPERDLISKGINVFSMEKFSNVDLRIVIIYFTITKNIYFLKKMTR